MTRRRSQTARRVALAGLLAVAATVSVGDDVVTAPDVRRGSRSVAVALPAPFPASTLHVPRTGASGVAIALHAGSPRALGPLLDALAASTLVVPVDASAAAVRTASCASLADALALTSRQAQREAGLTTYRPPLVVGLGGAERLTRDVVGASDPGVFAGGLAATPAGAEAGWACTSASAHTTPSRVHRWRDVPAADLVTGAASMLASPGPPPTTGHAPLDRWLKYFALPMAAEWAPRPRAVIVLMSDAHALHDRHPALAGRLAARDVSVLTIDALQYLWQRRSPRDVAFELRRLIGALTSLQVPIVVGGVGSGAETMAVAARYVEAPGPDGLVLIDPGPSAFFEVDPPLPALVPLIRADWSTSEAVEALAVPTVCAAGSHARTPRLCDALSALGHVTVVDAGTPDEHATDRLVADISALADRLTARVDSTTPAQPRKPST